jgi:hypothetical protein
MIQALIYLSINAGVLALFAGLWALDRTLKTHNSARAAAS